MRIGIGIATIGLLLTGSAWAQRNSTTSRTHWVTVWAAAEQQPRVAPPRPATAPASTSGSTSTSAVTAGTQAVAPPATPPRPMAGSFSNQTVRMIVRPSMAGSRIRVHLSNAFGATPLTVGAAHIAVRDHDSAIVASTDHALQFNGRGTVTIPPGAEMISDPLQLTIAPLADLAVSVFVPGETGPASVHSLGLHTTYISADGDFTGAAEIHETRKAGSWYWVSGVDVEAPESAGTIVTFGDSITDGATSTPDTDHSWPSLLAQRLQANPSTANWAVANVGISGNQLLKDGAGVNALARFDRDVLGQSGAKWLMILEGINDIGIGAKNGAVNADMLIGVLKQMAERAHSHGIKVAGCTLTPYVGAGYASDEGEAIRVAVNDWIRTSGTFDRVVDFEKVIQDPQNPKQFLKAYNIKDFLHPNDAGYQAMADAIDLKMFQ